MKGAIRYTLKQKIITLMVIFSIIFISAFSLIQVRNQLSSINTFNSYRARLSGLIVKNNLEKTIKGPLLEGESADTDIIGLLNQSILSLRNSDIIESAILLDKKCEIISSTGGDSQGIKLSPSDYRIVEECSLASREEKWFIPNIDTKKRSIDLYIPLYSNGTFNYIIKTTFSLGNIETALKQVYMPIALTIIIIAFVNLILGSILTNRIVKPINVLNKATKEIAGGNLKLKVDIATKDEIQELGETFNYMTDALQRMKDKAENANPLTKLPGNNVIREEIEKRIYGDRKFVAVHSDLDNFKVYNDKYGLQKGDEAIKLTAQIIQESLKNKGNPDDFVGHEGGDDFVFITTPQKVEEVTNYIIKQFDERTKALYKEEDRQRGFISGKDRFGETREFPLMSISLSGVSNQTRKISSYAELTNVAVEVKNKAKNIPHSVFILDKRTG